MPHLIHVLFALSLGLTSTGGLLPSAASGDAFHSTVAPLSTAVEAEVVLQGEVVDGAGQPVARALVITDVRVQATTDTKGRFSLQIPASARGRALRLTAVSAAQGQNFSASQQVIAPTVGVQSVGTLMLQLAATCVPNWIPTFGGEPGLQSGASAFAVFDDGTGPALFVGGGFASVGGTAAANIAKWDGATWSTLGAGVDSNVVAMCVFDDGSGPALYVAGWFSNAGGAPASRIARWNGTAWSTLGSGLNGAVNALLVFDDGTGPALFVGGDFTGAGGMSAERVAKWNGSTWNPLGLGLGSTTLGNKQVYALAAFDDGTGMALYAGGRITHTGTTPISIVSKWNGLIWQSVGNQFEEGGISFDGVFTMTVFDDGSGPALFIGGDFQTQTLPHIRHLAKWNGTIWSQLGAGVQSASVENLTVFDDGTGPALFVGGNMQLFGGIQGSLVRWNGSAFSELGLGPSSWTFSTCVFNDGSGPALFVSGNFNTAGGMPALHIAKWRNSTWSALGTGTLDHPSALAVLDDGNGPKLYAGFLNDPSGSNVTHVARWNGATWETMGSPLSIAVDHLVQFDSGAGPKIYAAG